MTMLTKRKNQPLAYQYYYYPVCVLVFLGILDTLYLVNSHYQNYTDISYSSFCAISKAINCDTVSQSSWSVLLDLPLAVWGAFGYLLFGIVFIAARKQLAERLSLWAILLLLGICYSLFSVYLGYVSATKIHSYCLMCLVSYLISFLLMLYAWIIRRRFSMQSFCCDLKVGLVFLSHNLIFRFVLFFFVVALGVTWLNFPRYWQYDLPDVVENINSGVTEDKHPWIGAENPEIIIEEFSDYQCFQCYKTHLLLRQIIEQQPNKIQLIHRHYPMDHEFNSVVVPEPFHVGSGKMALIAIYAAQIGKFWAVNDVLFELGRKKEPFSVDKLSELTGISSDSFFLALEHPVMRNILQVDIHRGLKLRITGTPSFLINGKVYEGGIPPEILKNVVQ